jgi:hypothetical protein
MATTCNGVGLGTVNDHIIWELRDSPEPHRQRRDILSPCAHAPVTSRESLRFDSFRQRPGYLPQQSTRWREGLR